MITFRDPLERFGDDVLGRDLVPNNLLATEATAPLRSAAVPSVAMVAEVPMQIRSAFRRCRTRRTSIATSAP